MDWDDLGIDWEYVVERLDRIIDLSEEALTRLLSDYPFDPSLFQEHTAFRWTRHRDHGFPAAVLHPSLADHGELLGLEIPLETLRRNTEQFVRCYPANNILLRGPYGSGKASSVKGLLSLFADQGLRLIEVGPEDLTQLPLMIDLLRDLPYRFLLFCEHLPLNEPEDRYRALKALRDGGIEEPAGNLLIYASCSKGPRQNTATAHQIPARPSPLLHCFGIHLNFPALSQASCLQLITVLARRRKLSLGEMELEQAARQWLEERGQSSGRVARQFIDDLCGRLALQENRCPE